MMRTEDSSVHEDGAAALGRMARMLDGSDDNARDLAARERLLFALGARPGRRARVLTLALAALALSASIGAALFFARPARVQYSVSGPLARDGEWLGVPPNRCGLASIFGRHRDRARTG